VSGLLSKGKPKPKNSHSQSKRRKVKDIFKKDYWIA